MNLVGATWPKCWIISISTYWSFNSLPFFVLTCYLVLGIWLIFSPTQPPTLSWQEMSSSLWATGWGSEWPYNAPQCHQLMPISYQFRDCKQWRRRVWWFKGGHHELSSPHPMYKKILSGFLHFVLTPLGSSEGSGPLDPPRASYAAVVKRCWSWGWPM